MPMPASGQARIVPAAPFISEFGACAARRQPDLARALMATPVGSREEHRAARRLAAGRSGCVRGRMRWLTMRAGSLRGAVAEALIENDPEAMARLRALPSQPPVRAAEADGRAFVTAYARCIADAEPARSARLLDLSPDAPAAEHRAAFVAFGSVLDDCMPIGLSYRLNPADMRDHIAMRLYEIAYQAGRPAAD